MTRTNFSLLVFVALCFAGVSDLHAQRFGRVPRTRVPSFGGIGGAGAGLNTNLDLNLNRGVDLSIKPVEIKLENDQFNSRSNRVIRRQRVSRRSTNRNSVRRSSRARQRSSRPKTTRRKPKRRPVTKVSGGPPPKRSSQASVPAVSDDDDKKKRKNGAVVKQSPKKGLPEKKSGWSWWKIGGIALLVLAIGAVFDS